MAISQQTPPIIMKLLSHVLVILATQFVNVYIRVRTCAMATEAVDIYPTLYFLTHYLVSGEFPIINGSAVRVCFECGLLTEQQRDELLKPLEKMKYGH